MKRDNKEIKKAILNKIVNKIDEKKKIYETIFKTYNVENNDFTSLIVKELKEKFYEYLVKIIVIMKKQDIFILFQKNILS